MHLAFLVTLLACVVSCWGEPTTQLQPLCPEKPASSTRVTLSTLRNQAGNWVSKVDMERGGGRGRMDAMRTEPWSVDVDSNTRTCEGAESILHVTLTITAPLQKAGPGYELFPGIGYYKFHNAVTTWPLARQICADEGGHLAIINSENEHEVLKTLFARFPSIAGASDQHWAWIGMHKQKDVFLTIFGEALNTTGFLTWATGHPTQAVDECGLINRKGGMAQVICHWKVAFVCEHEL